ncbi:hypothetical protein [Alcaligenes sp. YSL9]|uniref:hypothetical protein n=1 Tax=Alcaligenes TaxID=507 RepID=UPI00266D3514|nr:hypothetical protein [Alcaligenes sp. YSL9]
MASPSGDGGRDSELRSPDGEINICAQYSVTVGWNTKIKNTEKQLKNSFPDVKILIYLTNQEIGAKGDKIKSELLNNGIFLDIRDKNWFLDRFDIDNLKISGAEEFFERVGRPYLEGQQVITTKRSALSDQEAKAALVYLAMQWEDTNTDKGLTKLSYEALVRSALRKTNSENRMLRAAIHSAIHSYLPSQPIDSIAKYADSALKRLDKNIIKHREKEDSFHLAFEEHQRLSEKLAHQDLQERALDREIAACVGGFASDLSDSTIAYLGKLTKQILDLALLKSGENFAASVLRGTVHKLDQDLVRSLILEKLSNSEKSVKEQLAKFPSIIEAALDQTIKSQNEAVRKHLKTLSDTYTLFAFLRETPDVQKATKKIFSFGKIWLDTTLILPLLADQLSLDKIDTRFSTVVKNLIACGVEVFVCKSAVDEVINHIRISIKCAASGAQWQGRIPYLYSKYIQEGRNPSQFAEWVTRFRGYERPELDIQEFLEHDYGIKYDELTSDYERADEQLRFAVDRLWRDAHETRRNSSHMNGDSDTVDILIRNDVVSYLGIIERRKHEKSSELGYQHWWLTIDSTAWSIRDSLATEFEQPPSSPLMSLDFLVQNMSFGPNKSFLTRSDEQLLPVLLDLDISQVVPTEILHLAEEVRQQNEGQPEYVIRRKVRDACDRARRQIGDFTKGREQVQ